MGRILNYYNKQKEEVELRERRMTTIDNPNMGGGDAFSLIAKAIGEPSSDTGVQLTEENILTIPTVENCVSLISSGIAQLPVDICYYNDDGSIEKIQDDDRTFLLNSEPNEQIDAFLFKKNMVKDYLINGSAYVVVERKGNMPSGLYPIKTKDVSVEPFEDGYKTTAKLTVKGSTEIDPEDMLIVLKDSDDGFTGKGVLDTGKLILKIALGELYYSDGLLENGAIPTGAITFPGALTKQAFTNIKQSWQRNFGGAKNAGKTAILEGGATYKAISLKPNDLDLSSSKKTTVTEICKLFSVPESMVNSYANKYASTESNGLQFLQFCVGPIINAMESALNKTLLLEDEKLKGYFFRFDTGELTRTIESEKVETLVKAVEGRIISINEARGKLGYKSMPKDFWLYGLGDVLYNIDTNKLVVANSGLGINPDEALTPEEMAEMKERYKHDFTKDVQENNEETEKIIEETKKNKKEKVVEKKEDKMESEE